MPENTYTHKALARQLKVSETTIKSYRRKFPGCIPVASRGKPIRFSADALAVCRRIRDMFEKGMSVEEVRSRLALEFSWIEDSPRGFDEDGAAEPQLVGPPEAGDRDGAGVVLPPGFANAISGLAKSVVTLTRQQAEILSRLCSLEGSLQNARLFEPSSGGAGFESEVKVETVENSCPEWAGDLVERLLGVEETLVRTLESVGSSLGSAQLSDKPIVPAHHPAPPPQPAQTVLAEESGRILPWRGAGKLEEFHKQDASQGCRINEDFLRHISSLPLAVQVEGDYTGLAGRGPFCLNDLKAILAQTFSPPNHFVGRWETASGELWYMLEQPEEADSDSISLHLKPVETSRNQPMLEVAKLVLGGVNEHPTTLYTLVQQFLG